MVYHGSLQRQGGSHMLKTTNPLRANLQHLNGGGCEYYYMDGNVTMTNWMSPMSNDEELFHALAVSCRPIDSSVPEALKHAHVCQSTSVQKRICVFNLSRSTKTGRAKEETHQTETEQNSFVFVCFYISSIMCMFDIWAWGGKRGRLHFKVKNSLLFSSICRVENVTIIITKPHLLKIPNCPHLYHFY